MDPTKEELKKWYDDYCHIPESTKFDMFNAWPSIENRPLLSLVVPVYNTKSQWLKECIESVLKQIYLNWELCLCDNGSNTHTKELLEFASLYNNVKVIRSEFNLGGAGGTNAALDLVTGDYVGLLDSDDVLTEDALSMVASILVMNNGINILYTDEIMTDEDGNPTIPFFKPYPSKDLLCFLHYFSHLTFYKTSLIKQLKLRQSRGSYDYDLALRTSRLVNLNTIYHLPAMVYKYRMYPDSTSSTTKYECILGGLESLREHMAILDHGSEVYRNGNLYQVKSSSGNLMGIDIDSMVCPYKDYPFNNFHLANIVFKAN